MKNLVTLAVYGFLLAAWTVEASSKSTVTGHRFIRGSRDFDLYVIREALPTILLVHSSNEEECDPAQVSCAELFEDVKAAAAETKGYVRFATIDIVDEEARSIAKDVLKMTQKPPMMLAFQEKAESGSGGRPAMHMPTHVRPSVAQLKKIASDLLPKNVQRAKTLADFEKQLNASQAKKKTLITLFAPKLSDKPTPMLKAAWAMLQGVAEFTLVDYSNEEGKQIVSLVQQMMGEGAAIETDKNATLIFGISDARAATKCNETVITPDSIHEFATWLNYKKNKKSSTTAEKKTSEKKRKPISGVYGNMTQEDFERVVTRANTACITAIRRKENTPSADETDPAMFIPSPDEETNVTWTALAQTMFTQFGIHSAIVHCDNPADPPKVCSSVKNEWTYLVYEHRPGDSKAEKRFSKAATLKEAMDKATTSFFEAQGKYDDVLETFETAASAVDFLQNSMATWANPSLRSLAKIPVIYLDLEDTPQAPSYLLAAHSTMRGLTKLVRVRNPSTEVLQQLHLDPATVFFPMLVAYVPSFTETAKLAEEQKKPKQKGKNKANPPPKEQMAYHVVPFDPKRAGLGPGVGLQYETAVLFLQDLFQHVDPQRWETFMENVFPFSAPPALSAPITERLFRNKNHDVTKIPSPEKAFDQQSFKSACGETGLCVVVFAESLPGPREQTVEEARKEMEKSGVGGGIRIALVDGSCHGQVVESLGGDPTMLPVVSVFSPGRNVYSVMKGAFTAENLQSFVKSVKRGSVAVLPVSKNPVDLFTDLKECMPSGGETGSANAEDEDDLLKELREEAEREARAREETRKNAGEEARRLKEQREAELKSQREKMHKLAEEERLKKRKVQQDLDEQRLAKKKEQQRLDEERAAAAKQKKQEL